MICIKETINEASKAPKYEYFDTLEKAKEHIHKRIIEECEIASHHGAFVRADKARGNVRITYGGHSVCFDMYKTLGTSSVLMGIDYNGNIQSDWLY